MTFSPGGTCSATAALVSPIRGRRSKTSTSPSRSPSTSTVPEEGNIAVAATWSRVVLPAPFGPIRIHRSFSCAVQSTLRSSTAASRRTSTPRSRSTSSDMGFLPRLGWLRDRTYATAPGTSQPTCRIGWPELVPLVPHRHQRRLGAVLDAELGEHRADVRLHRLLRDAERARDLPVGPAPGQFREHLALAAGQRAQPRVAGGRAHQR